jgi:hypothetical protein
MGTKNAIKPRFSMLRVFDRKRALINHFYLTKTGMSYRMTLMTGPNLTQHVVSKLVRTSKLGIICGRNRESFGETCKESMRVQSLLVYSYIRSSLEFCSCNEEETNFYFSEIVWQLCNNGLCVLIIILCTTCYWELSLYNYVCMLEIICLDFVVDLFILALINLFYFFKTKFDF